MCTGAASNHLAYQLPVDAYYHLVRTLRLMLPPPLTDSPEDLVRHDHAAIAGIAALASANAAEAELAAQFVAASEQWKDCLRLAQAPETAPQMAMKCRAQANGMMRQANSALRLLLRLQEARRKLEADAAACDRAAWTEHCAVGLMAEALSAQLTPPVNDASAPPLPEPQSEPAPTQSGDIAATPLAEQPTPAPVAEPEPDPACPGPRSGVAAAECHAVIHPERAGGLGRLPDDTSFPRRPPDEDLAQALIAARTPPAAALDRPFPAARAA